MTRADRASLVSRHYAPWQRGKPARALSVMSRSCISFTIWPSAAARSARSIQLTSLPMAADCSSGARASRKKAH